MWTGMTADAGMVRYTNMTMKDCLRAAYRVRDFQVQGPGWMNDARFQITAKLPAGASREQIPEMMQGLLVERFKLAVRRDTKEQAVYVLGVGKGGPNLKAAQVGAGNPPETALGPDGRPRPSILIEFPPSGVVIHAPAATLAVLAETMSRFTERPVVDMTGITGQHQFDLAFAPEMLRGVPWTQTSGDAPAPSLFEAVQQYGLKLEARKAPIEMLTVVHVEKTPTEN
jgi:uncharacterized protein (TIGR03435 family)